MSWLLLLDSNPSPHFNTLLCPVVFMNSILSQCHFGCSLLEYKDFGKREKTTHLNEVTYTPSSSLAVLLDKEIQMQEEDSFMRFSSVAVIETFLAGLLYRIFGKILILPKN